MKYVLRYKTGERIPDSEIEKIERLPGITIVDRAAKMLLVEGSESALSGLIAEWSITPEQQYEIPNPRPKPRSRPA